MIGVTERARQELKRILLDNVDNPQAGLRLSAGESGQLSLGIDVEMEGDEIVEHDGSKVLLVENGLASSLEGLAVDIEDTPEGPRLVILKES
ncbi:hypothetical protein ACFLTY_01665 [Chloroflexota bacterium]